MPHPDAERWNARYTQEEFKHFEQPRPFLVEQAGFLPSQGLALDAAMGLGGNAGFLLQRGLRVIGVDVSSVAVRRAKQRLPGLMAVVADITSFALPTATFDVILNFFYLERSLWPLYRQALRPGGLLVIETLTVEMLKVQPEIEPVYLLAPGELRAAFADLEILVYREGWVAGRRGHSRAVASLVARV
ncbi:MAG: class I SAM-dependent methyltransferase [Chloroflexota bacterium]|nr:MAG: class I SAM-dependent methyltransferase [Chloroflexota bacterium]